MRTTARRVAAALLLAAPAAAACPERSPVTVAKTQVYSSGLSNGECFVHVEPSRTAGLTYRSLAFFDTGLLMAFSSYGSGPASRDTAAREFYFFPRAAAVDFQADPAAGTLSVTMADGDRVEIDPEDGRIRSVGRGTATDSPRVDRAGRGGLGFPSYDGLMLDVGFALGRSPADRRDGEAVFRDAAGRTCRVRNREVFVYDKAGDHAFRFDDARLSAWLKTRCPSLRPGF